jgi:hypothetical protein
VWKRHGRAACVVVERRPSRAFDDRSKLENLAAEINRNWPKATLRSGTPQGSSAKKKFLAAMFMQ